MDGIDEIKRFRAQLDTIIMSLGTGQKIAYSLDEAIQATSIGRSSLYEDIASGKLRARKRGRSTIILAEELNRYLAELPLAEIGQ